MAKYYYTYGSDGEQPFIGGWTEVEAVNHQAANKLFRIVHPDKTPGILNCAFVYTEAQFKQTGMYMRGNFGRFCVERLSLNQEVL